MSQLFKGIRNLRIRRVRSRAKKLVTNNRHREAIDLLQTANKRIHSPEIEKYLVDLRHEAFFHESFSSQFPNWPPAISDRFKTTNHIPEITTDQMSSDIVRDGVFSKGSIIIRGLLGNDDVVKIREGIELTYQNHDLSRAGYSKEQTSPWFVPFEPTQRHPDQILNRDWYREGGAELAADSQGAYLTFLNALKEIGLLISSQVISAKDQPYLYAKHHFAESLTI